MPWGKCTGLSACSPGSLSENQKRSSRFPLQLSELRHIDHLKADNGRNHELDSHFSRLILSKPEFSDKLLATGYQVWAKTIFCHLILPRRKLLTRSSHAAKSVIE